MYATEDAEPLTTSTADHLVAPMTVAKSEPVSVSDSKPRTPCLVNNCDQTFSRRSDLARHVSSRHEQVLPYACPANGCFKGQSPTRFARADKLTDHIRAVHLHHDATFRCPLTACGYQQPMFMPEVLAHFALADANLSHWQLHVGATNAFINASEKLKCPIWSCGQRVRRSEMLQHLHQHDEDQLEAQAESIGAAGYVVEHAAHLTVDSGQGSAARRSIVQIQCPVLGCQRACVDHKAFSRHLVFHHLVKRDQASQEHLSRWLDVNNRFSIWGSVDGFPWEVSGCYANAGRTCPVCLFEPSGSSPELKAQHLESIFRPDEDVFPELEPHRVQLLRLCPEFTEHSLYNYLRSTTGASES